MNILTTIKKRFVANEDCCILTEYNGYLSASFIAKLPKSAVVDHIRVDGKFIEDINTRKIRYHLEPSEFINAKNEDWRVVATVWFEEDDTELYNKLANYIVQDFEVYYHLEAVIEE